MRAVDRCAAIAALVVLTGCAWSDRANRPVWNAFEEKLVPNAPLPFALTLPLTIPGGLLAILVDSFVVHPATVIDDAADDAVDLWRGIEWEGRYYTELAALPFRALGTPIVFLGAFLARSCFDFDEPLTEEQRVAQEAKRERERKDALLSWFAHLARGGHGPHYALASAAWDADLDAAFEQARQGATSLGRAALYDGARRMRLAPLTSTPWMGLADPDPVVRYLEMVELPSNVELPAELRAALLADPVESVRELARARWK